MKGRTNAESGIYRPYKTTRLLEIATVILPEISLNKLSF